jgi:hypothetical protein
LSFRRARPAWGFDNVALIAESMPGLWPLSRNNAQFRAPFSEERFPYPAVFVKMSDLEGDVEIERSSKR